MLRLQSDLPRIARLLRPWVTLPDDMALQGGLGFHSTLSLRRGAWHGLYRGTLGDPRVVLGTDRLEIRAVDFSGRVEAGQGTTPRGELDLVLRDILLQSGEIAWRGPCTQFGAALAQADDSRNWRLDSVTVSNNLVCLEGAGGLIHRMGRSVLSLGGHAAVDLREVSRFLHEIEVPHPRMQGNRPQPFALELPLTSAPRSWVSKGSGHLALWIDEAEAFGLRAGPGAVSLRLKDGELRIGYAPPLQQGSLHMDAYAELFAAPPTIRLPAGGIVIRDAPLNEELVRLLGRANPLLAQGVVLSGTASIEVGNATLPLDGKVARNATDFDAVITLRDGVMAPGGVLAEMLDSVGARDKHLEIKQGEMRIACRGGTLRVAPHKASLRGHELIFEGNVGLDGGLEYHVILPLTSDLVGEDALRYLPRGQVKVVVTGTVPRPKIDRRQLASEVRKIATEAARRALSEKATDWLQNLRPRQE